MNNLEGDSIFYLETFFPYQVRMFYLSVSQSVSDIYGIRYGLGVAEWRTMAVLGNHQPLAASDVVQRSSIDKVQVSRAIQGLLKRELLERRTDPVDRRRVSLQLTAEGQNIFNDLVPRVRDLEQQLLSCLTEAEQSTLKALMGRVRQQAEIINQATAEAAAQGTSQGTAQANRAL
ncbi:MAG: MarR family transcriptional regulator [Motiliproteus sp.]